MIHLIYIYFIINAFIAGLFHSDLENIKYTLCWLFFGCLYPLAWICIRVVEITELRSLYSVIFTNDFANMDEQCIEILKDYYKYQLDNKRWWRAYVTRMVDKKYNYGITK